MSAIVPWTTPGGTPCCCAVQCLPNLSSFPQATIHTIDATTYAALYAGGYVLASASGDASAISTMRFAPNTVCATSRNASIATTIVLHANRCISAISSRQNTGAIIANYTHYLRHVLASNLYEVVFEASFSLTSATQCSANITTSVQVKNGTFIAGDQGSAGIYNCGFLSTCISTVTPSFLNVSLSGAGTPYSFSIPSFVTAFPSGFPFAQDYSAVSGQITGSFDWTPGAP